MDKNLVLVGGGILFPLAIFGGLTTWVWYLQGPDAAWRGYHTGLGMLGGFLPAIVLAMLIAGEMKVLADAYTVQVDQFLRGAHGIWGAFGIGILVPNMSGYTEVEKFWDAANLPLKVVLSGFFVSSRMLNLQTSVFFLPILGPRLSLIMYAICFVIGIIMTGALWMMSFVPGIR